MNYYLIVTVIHLTVMAASLYLMRDIKPPARRFNIGKPKVISLRMGGRSYWEPLS
jgi:hypothetical protein